MSPSATLQAKSIWLGTARFGTILAMLSNVDLLQAIAQGHLEVEPFSEAQLRAAGLTLHLGHDLLKPLPGVTVDVKKRILPEYREIRISDDEPYALAPQEFLLGHTLERITVGPQLAFLIEGRSTLARLGLTIVKTAMMVEPGHKDRVITLELANHGPNPILLYPLMKIARAVVHELKTPSTRPYDERGGKYRDQFTVGRPIFGNEFRVEKD